MKKTLLALAMITATTTAVASGYAEVIRIEPRFITVHEQQCREVAVERPISSNSHNGALGAIVGAAIGNQIGGGSGRDIATAAGAVIGYNHVNRDRGTRTEYRTVCNSVPIQIQRGEHVTFRYRGQVFTRSFD